jgi:hypothetical protein
VDRIAGDLDLARPAVADGDVAQYGQIEALRRGQGRRRRRSAERRERAHRTTLRGRVQDFDAAPPPVRSIPRITHRNKMTMSNIASLPRWSTIRDRIPGQPCPVPPANRGRRRRLRPVSAGADVVIATLATKPRAEHASMAGRQDRRKRTKTGIYLSSEYCLTVAMNFANACRCSSARFCSSAVIGCFTEVTVGGGA